MLHRFFSRFGYGVMGGETVSSSLSHKNSLSRLTRSGRMGRHGCERPGRTARYRCNAMENARRREEEEEEEVGRWGGCWGDDGAWRSRWCI